MIAAFLLLAAQASPDAALSRRVERVLERSPVIDGHNDLAWEIRELHDAKVEAVDLSADTARLPNPLQTDIPRLRKGHVGGQFWSVYIPADAPRAVEMTLEEIDIVRRFVAANPTTFELATTAADIRRIEKAGRIASLIGVEGGHQIDGRLSVLRQYRALGVAYMTLTHGKSLNWADSSTDAPRANGLSEFGRQVVAEMNRIGMIVDLSHVSEETMIDAMRVSEAPVIFSHSSARAVTGHPRNVPDSVLRLMPEDGGIVMVTFVPGFINETVRAWGADRAAEDARLKAMNPGAPEAVTAGLAAWTQAHPIPRAAVSDLLAHIQHVRDVAGIDPVGLGGDFDGIDALPEGITGVDAYPAILAALMQAGWTEAEIRKIAGENMLRVMRAVEAVAASKAGERPGMAVNVVP